MYLLCFKHFTVLGGFFTNFDIYFSFKILNLKTLMFLFKTTHTNCCSDDSSSNNHANLYTHIAGFVFKEIHFLL